VIVGGIAGGMGHSWILGIVGFIVVAVLAHLAASNEKAADVIALIIGAAWAVLALIALTAAKASDAATTIIPMLALVFGFSLHFLGFQMLRDLQRAKG